MAAAELPIFMIADEDEEFVTCGVCIDRYDLEDKKPKFLQCSHSLCLSCVKRIFREGNLCCPFCRCTFLIPNVESLPNNNYAIRMLSLTGKSKKTTPETSQRKLASMLSWCSACQSAGNSVCTGLGHLIIDVNFETVKKMEDMVKEKTELMKLKDEGLGLLAQIIQKRRSIEKRLSLVMESIHIFEQGVKKFQEDNNIKLTKAMSILDLNKQSTSAKASEVSQKEKDDLFISELISMIEDPSADDTIETLKRKMNVTLNTYRGILQESTWAASYYDVLEKLKIEILSSNETERPILTQTLTENDQSEKDVILLSELILCLLNRKNLLPTILKNIKPKRVPEYEKNSIISIANVTAEPTNWQTMPYRREALPLPSPPPPPQILTDLNSTPVTKRAVRSLRSRDP